MSGQLLKFRAWDKTLHKMFTDGQLATWRLDKLTADINYRVMQYTGLKDKNGKEIYESDFLMWDGHRYEIKFLNGEWILFRKDDPQYDRPSLYMIINPRQDNIEVIGNIYEN